MTNKRYSQIMTPELYHKYSKTVVFEALFSAIQLAEGREITEDDVIRFLENDIKVRCKRI